ncbi:MAG: zf-HC2 domain-containing protein [Candidatus Limnocylindrales bacterium]
MDDGARHHSEIVCRDVVDLATDYLECAVRGLLRRDFESHLAGCEDCRAYLGQLLVVIRAASHIPHSRPAQDDRARSLELFRTWRSERAGSSEAT